MLLYELVKEIIREWGGIIQVQNYWVDKDGKAHKVPTHGSYAATLSKFEPASDEAYQWMFDKGWARVSIEDHSIFINTSLKEGGKVTLTRAQREWVKLMRDEIYPAQHLHAVNIYGRPLDI